MKNFKEMLDKDLDSTFHNTAEFAQVKRIRCDGIDRKIPVIFDSQETEARRMMLSGNHADGIYNRVVVIRVKLSDLGKEPRNEMRFWIDNDLYTVTEVTNEYNELIIELERSDE
jgi:hypothetical protein